MIVVYPMLVSNTINYAAIPGVAKAIERYLLIHRLDDILKESRRQFKLARGRIQLKEDGNPLTETEMFYVLNEDDDKGYDDSGSLLKPMAGGDLEDYEFDDFDSMTQDDLEEEKERLSKEWQDLQRDSEKLERDGERLRKARDEFKKKAETYRDHEKLKRERENIEKERLGNEKSKQDLDKKQFELQKAIDKLEKRKEELEKKEVKAINASSSVSLHMESMSLEPTWMQVDRYVKNVAMKDLIGIKVVPYVIASDEKMLNLLMYDKHLRNFDSKMVALGRNIQRKVYNLYADAVSRIPLVGGMLDPRASIKGDVKTDVLMAKTKFRKNIFVCINKMDLEDDFFQATHDVNKLFKLGWGSVIAMDDSKKLVHFCAEEYKGGCFAIQYSFLHSTLGKQHAKVFEDLTDVRKASGGIFSRKIPKRKVFSESILNKYLPENNNEVKLFSLLENTILKENDFEGKKESLGVIRQIRDYLSVFRTGDVNKIEANIARKTKFKNSNEVKKEMAKNPLFRKSYNLAKSELSKTIKTESIQSKSLIEPLAMMVGVYSLRDYATKNNDLKYTKKFIERIQKRIDQTASLLTKKKDAEKVEIDKDYIVGLSCFIVISSLLIPIALLIVLLVVKYSTELASIFGGVVDAVNVLLNIVFFILKTVWMLIQSIFGVLSEIVGGVKWATDSIKESVGLITSVWRGLEIVGQKMIDVPVTIFSKLIDLF